MFRTLGHDYREQGVEPPFRGDPSLRIAGTRDRQGAIAFDPIEQRLTFQDPCPFESGGQIAGRRGGTSPQAAAAAAAQGLSGDGGQRRVGPVLRQTAPGPAADAYSKALQVKRLRQARETGSNLLVTACPKCQIHLRCAMEDPFRGEEIRMEMQTSRRCWLEPFIGSEPRVMKDILYSTP